jgi:hypothetical protein
MSSWMTRRPIGCTPRSWRRSSYCSDFQIRFEPAPPVEATFLEVTTTNGDVINVQLPARG